MPSFMLTSIETGNNDDAELAVDGGILELEEEDDESLSSPLLLLRGGGGDGLESATLSLSSGHSSLRMPETIIEQTLRPDGSMSIKASTISPHPNGFRDVRIEHYAVPSSEAASIDTSPGSPPPGSEYLTRVEYRVLSPGSELEQPADDDDASTVYTVPVAQYDDCASVSSTATYRRSNRRRKKKSYWTLILISVVAIFFIVVVGVAVARDYTHYDGTAVPPDPDNKPSPSAPESDTDASPERTPERFDHHHHRHNRHTHEDKNGTLPSDDGPGFNSTALS